MIGRTISHYTISAELGRELGVSKERIRQIEQRALLKLREAARQKKLEIAA